MIHLASASGNVFAYLWSDEVQTPFDGASCARKICPKGRGLGVDGVFLLERPTLERKWTMTHWDPDGSQSFCSNGTRAAAALLGPEWKGFLEVTASGESVQLQVENSRAALRLPEGPEFNLSRLRLPLDEDHAYGWTGTPQLVLEIADVPGADLSQIGPRLRHHPDLPHGANVSLVQVESPGHARIRTWERGVEGETLCCGQGCAFAGVWLASRTGIPVWTFMPLGEDPVSISVNLLPDGLWKDLWLAGPVRHLGTVMPGRDLEFA